MPEVNRPLRRVVFRPYEVDFRTGELRKNGVRIRLQAQPFRILEMLLEHPGDVVTREELKSKLWPAATFGDFDHGLNKAVNKIREALNDSAPNPRFIETVARRGYRFIADVTAADERSSTAEPVTRDLAEANNVDHEATARPRPRRGVTKPFAWTIASACLMLFLAAFLIWRLRPARHRSPDIRSVAVLPLENLSSDISQEYFADGMTDELITALGTINGLRVISRTSVMLYKHARKSLPKSRVS